MLLAYFGPETMLPLTSILAAVGGFMLMFGRNTLRIGSALMRKIVKPASGRSPASIVKRPHVLSRDKYATESSSPAAESEREANS